MFVSADEAGDYVDAFAEDFGAELLDNKRTGQFTVEDGATVFAFGLDECARVVEHTSAYQAGDDAAAEAFAIADDCRLGLWTEVTDEVDTLID